MGPGSVTARLKTRWRRVDDGNMRRVAVFGHALRHLMTGMAVAVVAAAPVVSPEPAAAWKGQQCPIGTGSTVVEPGISGAALRLQMNSLRRGETMYFAPGVYEIGQLTVYACHATAANPIIVTALDPAKPPLLKGGVYLRSPDHWLISHMRFEGTVAGKPSLQVSGGTGWVLDHLEVYGASRTGAYGNLAVGSANAEGPSGFVISNSCVHDGSRPRADAGFHNIYVNASAGPGVSGVITRNVIFNHPGGGGIKLGKGGVPGAVGPWNVLVERNTIVGGGFGVVLHGRISHVVLTRNLMGRFSKKQGAGYGGAKRAGMYSHYVQGRGNAATGNYFFETDMVMRRTGAARIRVGPSNVRGPTPRFEATACGGWVPSGRAAGYGARS